MGFGCRYECSRLIHEVQSRRSAKAMLRRRSRCLSHCKSHFKIVEMYRAAIFCKRAVTRHHWHSTQGSRPPHPSSTSCYKKIRLDRSWQMQFGCGLSPLKCTDELKITVKGSRVNAQINFCSAVHQGNIIDQTDDDF